VETRQELLKGLTNEEAYALLHDWELWARPKQLPPPGDWYVWLLLSGRGFGKTRTINEWLLSRIRSGVARRIALVGRFAGEVRDTMVELGPSSLMQISPPWDMPTYEPSKRRVTWPNGAEATTFSGDDPDQLRGPELDTAIVDELAKFKYPQKTWDNLEMACRSGTDPRIAIATTPRPIPIIRMLLNDPQTVTTRGSTYENRDNLAARTLERLANRYEGTRLGRQELEREVLEDNPEALWQQETIERNRVNEHPTLTRIGVAIDPQATNNEASAETGILVGGFSNVTGHVYILADLTVKGTPDQWGSAAVSGYHVFRADRIIGEINNGGDMIEHVIRSIPGGKDVPYTKVTASRGKAVRAEPVSALYEQNKVHHVGAFPELEDQMVGWVPGNKSPDRLDALVWLVWWLVVRHSESGQEIPEEPQTLHEQRLRVLAGDNGEVPEHWVDKE